MIGTALKAKRIEKGISQAKLAEITGYTRGHLSNIINGNFDSVRAKKVVSLALCREFNELWTIKDSHNS